MLAIARGLMSQPRLLLLDEPSLGLSPILVAEIFRMIEQLRDAGHRRSCSSEQNARMSLAIADRAYVIETGRVTLAGSGQELARAPRAAPSATSAWARPWARPATSDTTGSLPACAKFFTPERPLPSGHTASRKIAVVLDLSTYSYPRFAA